MFDIKRKSIDWAGRKLTLETGRIARQADAAVLATYGETTVLATVVAAKAPKPGIDFFPLTVNYQEKTFAAGKIPGGFFKREGRPSEKETLVSRLIDRPIRPLFVKGFKHETQVVCTVLSHDLENDPDIVAMVAASAALTLSGVPFMGPIGAARIGYVDGEFVVNPTADQMADIRAEMASVMASLGAPRLGHAHGPGRGQNRFCGLSGGLVAAAEGGTLFLDEVGELPLPVQVKLLRLLQQREYTPLGETQAVKCDVRIVAATNRRLDDEVKAGRFREDLYYRLNVIHLELPALRERRGDLKPLARHFCRLFSDRAGRGDLLGLSEAALSAIEAYPWPGNVRALENAIERGVLLARGPYVKPGDVFGHVARALAQKRVSEPPPPPPPSRKVVSLIPRTLPENGVDLFDAIELYQDSLVKQALARTNGNRNQAARLLKMNRTTLVERIRRRGL